MQPKPNSEARPVSYTHLDVYKRQVCTSVQIDLSKQLPYWSNRKADKIVKYQKIIETNGEIL